MFAWRPFSSVFGLQYPILLEFQYVSYLHEGAIIMESCSAY